MVDMERSPIGHRLLGLQLAAKGHLELRLLHDFLRPHLGQLLERARLARFFGEFTGPIGELIVPRLNLSSKVGDLFAGALRNDVGGRCGRLLELSEPCLELFDLHGGSEGERVKGSIFHRSLKVHVSDRTHR